MNTENKTATSLVDVKPNVKYVISALWTTLIFIYIYVDFFYMYIPGELEHMMAGKMGPFPTSQFQLLSAMILMTIPSLMVFLSLVLKAKANRWTNIIVGILYILVAIGSVIGEGWAYYIVSTIVELVLLALIVWFAWKWPRQSA